MNINAIPPEFMELLTFPILQKMSAYMEGTFADSRISFSRFYSNKLETGEMSWREPEKFRSRFQHLYAKHIEKCLESIPWSSSLKVLELGAGYLTEGRSRLSRFLPEAEMCYSDLSLMAVENAHETSPSSRYLHMNSSRLSEKIMPSSIDVVIASCFLDTLPEEDLIATLEQVTQVLKPGGTFFHISDLEPYFNTLVIDHSEDPDIMFPCLDDDKFIKGIQFVSREDCVAYIARSKTQQSVFLNDYIRLSNDARCAVVIEICTMLDNACVLSKWVKDNFTETRVIVNAHFFSERLERGLRINHLAVVTLGNRVQSCVYSREESREDHYDDICAFHGRLMELEKKVLHDENKVRKTLGVHVLIARKDV